MPRIDVNRSVRIAVGGRLGFGEADRYTVGKDWMSGPSWRGTAKEKDNIGIGLYGWRRNNSEEKYCAKVLGTSILRTMHLFLDIADC